ncbi:hypothetical protein OHA98_41855 [Streptomyces sp. NBC_00654]|uniref:hypothetical protein n=1 Tax=Streptomyces sp. NBC_00654 TaxID=2975799 RepID=UPI002257F318|nr:hypothetical protein [Streptomyces sp. NBC_00654]MCX4969374.1 hypothetical protein [Streptomyces sp. NBC_00654]MCX4971153.1 hypothetical protein [Streptomyces sp. NBC_00654]
MKVSVDKQLAETVPDGTFGGARPRPRRGRAREQQRRKPDPDAARHWAELGAAVAEIDHSNGYGVNNRYRQTRETAA